MAWNVAVSWAGQFVFVVAGFIMPRMIDRRLGQETLGIWDFSWSMVGYFGLIQVGVGSSVGRYVAKYRVRGEMNKVSEVVSSIGLLLFIMGLIVLGLTLTISRLLPLLWHPRLGERIGDAQVVLTALGAGLAVEVALGGFAGVITGCHRWDIHNYIKAGWHLVTIVGMIVLLRLGLGIRSLAWMSLAGLVLADLNRVLCAFWLCPGMRVGPHLVRLSTIVEAFRFGIKTMAPRLGDLLLNQTSSILVASVLGPAALALYSRPKSLVQHTGMLVSKLAFVLTPTASALHTTRCHEELRELFISATRYAAYISLPLTIGLSIMGGPLLLLWMGSGYQNQMLVVLLSLGSFSMFTFLPAMSILTGLDAHGRPGMVHLLSSVCSVGLVALALGPLGMGLEGVAVAAGLPLTVAYGVYVSAYACRRLGLAWTRFLAKAFAKPLLCTAPLALSLLAARMLMRTQPLHALWLGSATGAALLATTYWRYVLPERIKIRLFHIREAGSMAA
jgi:O-antigen/teichoic acid export membrane protein